MLPVIEFKSSNSNPAVEAATTGEVLDVFENVVKVGGELDRQDNILNRSTTYVCLAAPEKPLIHPPFGP